MLASVLYYTSWENSGTPGAFDIYSRSPDVSDDDARDIIRAAEYRNRPDPTLLLSEEERASLLLPKYTYFTLESGKKCISCTTYVGKDCFGREGNYFVHALILPEKAAFPASFIGSTKFKSNLTPDEAAMTEPPVPASVEAELFAEPLTKEELLAFFDDKRLETLEKLASVLEGLKLRKVGVLLNDEPKNVRLWIAALYYVLSDDALERLSFSVGDADRSFSLVCNSRTNPYINAIDIQNFVFDIKDGSCDATPSVSEGVRHACRLFKKDPELVRGFTKELQMLSKLYFDADLDGIFRIWAVKNSRFDVFQTPSELRRTLSTIFMTEPDQASRITKNAVFALSFTLTFNKSFEYTDLLGFLYRYADSEASLDLLSFYLEDCLERSAGVDEHKFCETVKSGCICPWSDALSVIFTPKILDRIAEFDTPAAKFLICTMMIDSFPTLQEPRKSNVVTYLSTVCMDHIVERNVEYAALVQRTASHIGAGLERLINERICQCNMEVLSRDPDLTFEYIEKTQTSGDLFWTLVINCAKYSPDNVDALVKGFLRFCKVHFDQKSSLYAIGEKEETSRVFLRAVSLYEFEQRDSYDSEYLTSKYEEFMCEDSVFIAEKAKRIYLETLGTYLSTLGDTKRIETCIKILERIFAKNLPQKTDSRILRLMNHAMFSQVRLCVVQKCTTADFIENFVTFTENAKVDSMPVARAIIEGNTFRWSCGGGEGATSALRSIAQMAQDRSFTFAKGELSAEDINDYGDAYMVDMLNCALCFAKTDEKLFASFMEEILSYMLGYERFVRTFERYLEEDQDRTRDMLVYIFDFALQSQSPIAGTVMDIATKHLERASGAKRKRILSYLCENVRNKTKMEKFTEVFLSEHRTFGAGKLIKRRKNKS